MTKTEKRFSYIFVSVFTAVLTTALTHFTGNGDKHAAWWQLLLEIFTKSAIMFICIQIIEGAVIKFLRKEQPDDARHS